MAHAKKAIMEARRLPPGPTKSKLWHIGSVYHLLAKQGANCNISFIEDFRLAKQAEERLRMEPQVFQFPV